MATVAPTSCNARPGGQSEPRTTPYWRRGGVPCCVQQDGGEPIPPHPYLRGFGGTWYIEARAAVESDSVRIGEDIHLRESKPGQQNLIEEAAGAHYRSRRRRGPTCRARGATPTSNLQTGQKNSRIVRVSGVGPRSRCALGPGRRRCRVSRLYR